MSYPENIHPWTIDWFESLPQSYQSLDAVQKNPPLIHWDGLNEEPYDMTEAGGWTKYVDFPAGSYILQGFKSPPGMKVHYQIWAEPGEIPGGALHVVVSGNNDTGFTGDIEVTGETSVEDITGTTLLEGWFYPPRTGLFSVLVGVIAANHDAPIPGSKPVIKAINISRRQVTYDELPDGTFTNPETFHPLLRFMDGIGQIGGQYRELSDQLWDGHFTNPESCPDESLPWLAQMAGINRNVYRILPADDLRELIKSTQSRGLAALGSRSAIADIVRPYLSGEKLCLVGPHPTKPHTIVISVNFTEVPNNDLPKLAENIRKTRVIPAGHVIEITEMLASWDAWEAAAGSTWAELEAKAKRWGEQDTLGVSVD